jgi:hypothetical protein
MGATARGLSSKMKLIANARRQPNISSIPFSVQETSFFQLGAQALCTEAMGEYDMASQGVIHISKPMPAELLKQIKPFLSNVDDRICLWPIVEFVMIRTNYPLLQERVEIIDLPGMYVHWTRVN